MRRWIIGSLVSVLTLASALALAQTAPGPGIHAIALPKASSGAKQVQKTTLLETPHLKLVSIVIPKGGTLPAHAATGQVSVHAISGTGELQMGDHKERLDAGHLIVLAPGAQHEVRAGAEGDLTLLVHEILGGRGGRMMGRGMGQPGAGGMGMGPGGRMRGVATPDASVAPK